MKIVDLKVTSVNVDFEAPLRWSLGVETGTTRGIVEVTTEDGVVGLGETYGGNGIEHAVATARPFVIGLDALDVGVLMRRFAAFCIGYETAIPAVVRAGIEMACLDAAGRSLGLPVYKLLGGKTRDRIQFGAYVFYRYRDNATGRGGEDDPAAIAERRSSGTASPRSSSRAASIRPRPSSARWSASAPIFPTRRCAGTRTPPGRSRPASASPRACWRAGSTSNTSRTRPAAWRG